MKFKEEIYALLVAFYIWIEKQAKTFTAKRIQAGNELKSNAFNA